jgi:7-cyano-7-deazaguanine synthase in queuosine biosynthesis
LTAGGPVEVGAQVLPLNLWSGRRDGNDIELKMEDLHKRLYKAVPAEFEDLLEIAAYVYCADQATSRGGKNVDGFGDAWRRHFCFKIPVRRLSFWKRAEVGTVLRETLEFLSDDYFDFEFVSGKSAPRMQQYFPNLVPDGPGDGVEGVVLFSGGLDSLAGAVEEAVAQKRRVLLVTHKPTEKLNGVHAKLQALLKAKAGNFAPTHLYVRINKDSALNKDYTQRTRSFLYAAVGATVAQMQGLDLLRFYENGVVTMNLPVCAQVVGSRATRTTHPRVLAGFEKLFSLVAGSPFRVQNPFLWDTKADVVERILKQGCGELIGASVSCAHTWLFSHEYPHCGTCSQCIDRRVGIVAAEAEGYDPAGKYKSDVFTGVRPSDEDRMMVATYVERANEIAKLGNATELIARYPEVVGMLDFLEGKPAAAAAKVLELHKRHAQEVNKAIERTLAANVKALRERTLPVDCLLRLTYDSGGGGLAMTAPVAQPATEQQKERWEKERHGPNDYRLTRDYKVWRLVYRGEEVVLAEERGVALANHLLKHPPEEPIHATVLEVKVDGAPVAGGQIGGVIQEAAGAVLNAGDNTLLKRKLLELKAAAEDETLPESEREEAAEEFSKLLRSARNMRRSGGQADRVALRVRKALRRFIDDLESAESGPGEPHLLLRAFGEHLEDYLWLPSVSAKNRKGAVGKPGCFTYLPPEGVVWRD